MGLIFRKFQVYDIWVALFASSTMSSSCSLLPKENAERNMVSTIPIEVTEGYITLSATVEGIPARLLLDTGADATVIGPKIFEKLHLTPVRYHESGVAGGRTIRIPLVELKAVQIGNAMASLNPVAVVDMNQESRPFGNIDGVLGSDFIKKYILTIDYPNRRLIFETPESYKDIKRAGKTVPLHLLEGTAPYLNVELNGKLNGKLKLANEYKLDTGAGRTHLRIQDLETLGYRIDKLKRVESQGLGGRYEKVAVTLQSLSVLEGISKRNFEVFAYSTKIGFIGADFLSAYRLTLNYQLSELVFSE